MSVVDTTGAPPERLRGEVLWYSEQKGWGVVCDDRGRLVTVDYAAIAGEGFRTLQTGQRLELEVLDSPHGPVAEHVATIGVPRP